MLQRVTRERPITRLGFLASVLAAALLPRGAAAAEVGVAAFGPTSTAREAWVPERFTSALVYRLRLLGVEVSRRPALEAGDAPREIERLRLLALVRGTAEPAVVERPEDTVTIRVEIDLPAGKPHTSKKLAGSAKDLDRLAARMARQIAAEVGHAVDPAAEALIEDLAYPFLVNRYLGMADRRLAARQYLQAAMLYGRADGVDRDVLVPEAIVGRALADAARKAEGRAEAQDRTLLTSAALERLEVALQRNRLDDARKAAQDFLRYTTHRTLAWSIEVPTAYARVPRALGAKRWFLETEMGAEGLLIIDPSTGAVVGTRPSVQGLVDGTDDYLIRIREREMARVEPDGKERWRQNLQLDPLKDRRRVTELTSGLLAVAAEDAVAWYDASFGKVMAEARPVRPLGSSAGGFIVLDQRKKAGPTVALLRPGRRAPAWRFTPPGEVSAAALTLERVVVLTAKGVVILRSQNGKTTHKGAISVGQDARLLGAAGRFAAVASSGGEVSILDIRSTKPDPERRKIATVRGPGQAVASYTYDGGFGVAILYESGDLLFYDEDGNFLDRARVPGRPLELVAGDPHIKGPVVFSTAGLFAYSVPPSGPDQKLRDGEGMLRLAEILERAGQNAAALRLATWVALQSSGAVARAEDARASLLEKDPRPSAKKAAAWARHRATAARSPDRSLPPFSLVGSSTAD